MTSVDFILLLFGNGWTVQEVPDNYPGLSAKSLQAVFAYAGECMSEEALYDLPAEANGYGEIGIFTPQEIIEDEDEDV